MECGAARAKLNYLKAVSASLWTVYEVPCVVCVLSIHILACFCVSISGWASCLSPRLQRLLLCLFCAPTERLIGMNGKHTKRDMLCPYITWKAIIGKNTSELNFTLSSCPSTTLVDFWTAVVLYVNSSLNVKLWLVVLCCVLEGGIWDGLSLCLSSKSLITFTSDNSS